jgi:hypothetical protein
LKARVVVTTYNHHVRLLSPEPFGWFAPPKSTRVWEPTLLWNHFTHDRAELKLAQKPLPLAFANHLIPKGSKPAPGSGSKTNVFATELISLWKKSARLPTARYRAKAASAQLPDASTVTTLGLSRRPFSD